MGQRYFLYKKQYRENGIWSDVVPNVYSINGEGTMPLEIADSDAPECDGAVSGNSKLTLYGDGIVEIPCSTNPVGELAEENTITYRLKSGYTSADIGTCVRKISKHGMYKTMIKTVNIPDTVTHIEDSAFMGVPLTGLTIPDSVRLIGGAAFAPSLTHNTIRTLTIPSSVQWIGWQAGYYGYTGGTVPQYHNIDGAFEGTIPTDVTRIDEYGREAKTSYLNANAKWDGSSWQLDNIPDISQVDGLTSVTIPESVIYIGDFTFRRQPLTSVYFPNNDCQIGNGLFQYCKYLQTASLPYGMHLIPQTTFMGCINLRSFEIPKDVSRIENDAFEYCNSLDRITIPPSVMSIDANAFRGCHNMRYLSFQYVERYLNINSYAFSNCYSLRNVSLPDGLWEIGPHAFHNCFSMQNLTIPETVTRIREYAFAVSMASEGTNMYVWGITGATPLTVTCYATTPPPMTKAFDGRKLYGLTIRVPSSSLQAYRNATGWMEYADCIQSI